MKITTYQPAVNPTTLNAPAAQVSQDVNAYGGKGDGYSDFNADIGQINKVLAQKQSDEDAADVIDARNQIMTSMTDQLYGDNGLLTTGLGANAKGLTDRVTDAIKKTTDDITQKQNPRVAYALRQNISDNMANFQRIAASQERDQKQAYDKTNYESALSNNNQLAALNYDKPEFLQAQIKQNMILMTARGKSQGWDGNILEANRIGMITDAASGAAMAAINDKDYDTANKILTTYKSNMDQGTYGKLIAAVKQKQEIKQMDLQTRDILSQVTRPDGSIDLQKAHTLIDGINGPSAVKTIQQKGISSKEDFYAAVAGQESGGNYDAQNADSGAFGKYQIMPANWESWKNEAAAAGIDVGSGDMSDPQAQEAVAKFKLGQYYDQFGAAGALVAWYAGPENAERYAEGQTTDTWGNDWNKPQSNGPSIQSYVDQSLGRLGGGPQETTASAYDPEANEKMKNLFDAMAADQMRAQAQQKKDYEDSVAKAMQNAGSYSGAVSYLTSLGDSIDMDTANRLKSSAAAYYGVNQNTGNARGARTGRAAKVYNPANDQKTLEVNNLKLQMGKELTAEEIVSGNNASARLIANGYDSGGADLDNGKVMSSITDMLDNGASKSDIHDALIASGASEETANYYVDLIDSGYDS